MHVQMIHIFQIWSIDPLFSSFICISPSYSTIVFLQEKKWVEDYFTKRSTKLKSIFKGR